MKKIKQLSWAMLPREGTWGSLNGTDPQKLTESGTIRRCGFVEVNMVLEWRQALRAYMYAQDTPSVSVHFLLPLNQVVELSAPSPAPCLPACCLLPAVTMA